METLNIWTKILINWATLIFFVGMTVRLVRILRYPYKKDMSQSKGDPKYGAFYALTFAMLPWKKESTKKHWLTYTAGMIMHVGVFAIILFALARRLDFGVEFMINIIKWIGPLGLVLAFSLFVKRATLGYMKAISNLDDYFSNLLVDFYLLAGTLTAYNLEWLGLWRLAAILLLIWIPFGKIFHMVLFFISRVLFGLQFGRRGVIKHGPPITY